MHILENNAKNQIRISHKSQLAVCLLGGRPCAVQLHRVGGSLSLGWNPDPTLTSYSTFSTSLPHFEPQFPHL